MRLAEVSERLDLIYKLQKKHRVSSIRELIDIRENLSENLVSISSSDEELVKLEKEIEHLKAELIDISDTLSASRNEVIPSIEDKVKDLLAEVGMPNSTLKIESILLGEDELNVNGRNRIQFLFSANKGQAPAPMNKVASGGELSRLMLAIKSLISRHIALPTIIFDEIDTGISGEVALKVGKIMEKLSESMQVIAITHLPQIASKGNAHYWVYKDDSEDITHTNIRQLNTDERVTEIAKMLSGENPGEFAIQHARELLEG
jgi:DNA repair protein RecN (Recombination protein N)